MRYGNDTVTAKNTGHKAANYTGYGWAGDDYDATLTTKEIAARIRKQVREKYPASKGYKISVTYKSFSGGSSIDVRVKAAPFDLVRPEYLAAYLAEDWEVIRGWEDEQHVFGSRFYGKSVRYTEQADELVDDLKKLTTKYRCSDSDGMIDYFSTNFYDHVEVDFYGITEVHKG